MFADIHLYRSVFSLFRVPRNVQDGGICLSLGLLECLLGSRVSNVPESRKPSHRSVRCCDISFRPAAALPIPNGYAGGAREAVAKSRLYQFVGGREKRPSRKIETAMR
jgi:hypothetical protein